MLAKPPEPDAHRLRRNTAIRHTVVAALGGRVVAVACSLTQIPLALALLGRQGFGFWAVLTSATAMLGVADFGLGAGMQNQIATALARNETQRAASLFATTFGFLWLIAGGLFGFGFPVMQRIDWAGLFHLSDPRLIGAAPRAAIAALMLFCAGLPLSAATRLVTACQWGWLAALWAAGGSVLQLGAVVLAGFWQLSFPGFVVLVGCGPVAAGVGLLVHAWWRLRWRAVDARWASKPDRQELFRTGFHFCLPQIGATFIYNIAPPVIGALAGPTTVAGYQVLQRLFGLFGQLQQIVLAPTWPAYTEAATRHDQAWIRLTYRRSFFGTIAGIGLPLVITAWLAPLIVEAWTRPTPLQIPPALIWTVCLWNLLLCLGQPPANLLGGLGRVRRLAYITFVGHIASAASLWFLGEKWGATGVVAGLIVGYGLIGLPGTYFEAHAALAAATHAEPQPHQG